MTNIDQFESVFKAAIKTPFEYAPVSLATGLVVTDRAADDVEQVFRAAQRLLSDVEGLQLAAMDGSQFDDVGRLLDLVADRDPDVIITYRNLHSNAWRWPHSLGDYLDVLTQVARQPVLVLPHPDECRQQLDDMQPARTVMAITDHLAGDHNLVNYAQAVTADEGKLVLANVQDEAVVDLVIEAIEKLPEIDTDVAREAIPRQLLKEPHDYVVSCRQTLLERRPRLRVEEVITHGHYLRDYARIIDEQAVDLIVLHTKDDDQAAMHGLAYPLSVELRDTPLLML